MNHKTSNNPNWIIYSSVSLIGILAIAMVAGLTKTWVLTALPIGFLFGFFLQKGDLCGSSAFSEVIMFKDRRKIYGLWILIVVAMLGFAMLDIFDLVTLNPKPLRYLSYLVGGTIFGIGIVLAGGCVSGCLYKAGTGNLNSIVALLGIPVGVMMVEFGPLHKLHTQLKQTVIKASDGSPVTLNGFLGLPFWLVAVIIASLTFLTITWYRSGHKKVIKTTTPSQLTFEKIITKPWKPWAAGLAIGLLMIPAYLSSAASGRNYPLGVTHGVMQAELILVEQNLNHIYGKPSPPSSDQSSLLVEPPKPGAKKVVWWLVALVTSLVLGSWTSARLSGQAKLLPKPPDELLIAIVGGVLVGIGAALATGCVVGNIMSGWALLSVGTILFGIVTMLTNWITTYFYMMGGNAR